MNKLSSTQNTPARQATLSNNLGQASIIQKLDNTIHRINHYPANK